VAGKVGTSGVGGMGSVRFVSALEFTERRGRALVGHTGDMPACSSTPEVVATGGAGGGMGVRVPIQPNPTPNSTTAATAPQIPNTLHINYQTFPRIIVQGPPRRKHKQRGMAN
jgi:hypothetical protein